MKNLYFVFSHLPQRAVAFFTYTGCSTVLLCGLMVFAPPAVATERQHVSGGVHEAVPSHTQNISDADAASLQKFCRSAFARQSDDIARQSRGTPVTIQQNATAAKKAELHVFSDTNLTFSGSNPAGRRDHPIGPVRAPLPGNKHTLSQIDNNSTPEMEIAYKMQEDTTVRLAVNQQDQDSPLYSPLEEDASKIAATGVFVDTEVGDQMTVQFGAEYRRHEGHSLRNTEDSKSSGASVGLKWAF